MKYDMKTFYREVNEYKNELKSKASNKLVFVVCDISNEKAFYSLAPLSMAVHELNGEMHVVIKEGHSENLRIANDLWAANTEINSGTKSKRAIALSKFIAVVVNRTKNSYFEQLFTEPEIRLSSSEQGFTGSTCLKYKSSWHRDYRKAELVETAMNIWKNGYKLNGKDKASINFTLLPAKKNLELPISDYLDNFSIAIAMSDAAKKLNAKLTLGASTDKFSILENPVRSADMIATIRGCELDKNINEDAFISYRKLSEAVGINRMEMPSASFGIRGKGFFGKHYFGEQIGYPTPNMKTRWLSATSMMMKDRNAPQSRFETRDPLTRLAITETLPIDVFIKTCNVDYAKLRKRSLLIKSILDKCKYVRITGKKSRLYTDFTVHLTGKSGRREFIAHDSDVTSIIDMEHYKKTGIRCGTYANFPSGEAFVTPEEVEGTIIGDVVINVDQSHRLSEKEPVILQVSRKQGYRVLKGPKKLLGLMRKQWKDSRKRISDMEKSGSIPRELTEMYKQNFNRIGEFAINTNPEAEISDYLIVNEKIARMIHVALGSGFASDRACVYHWDIVVNSPRQKLDIYGVDDAGSEHWIIRKGEFVV